MYFKQGYKWVTVRVSLLTIYQKWFAYYKYLGFFELWQGLETDFGSVTYVLP